MSNPRPPCIHCGTRVNNINEYVQGAKPEVGLKRVINGLKVTCMNNANPKKGKSRCECDWVGKLIDFDSHSRNQCQVRNDVDRAICLREPGKMYSVTFPMGEQPFGLRMGNRLINEKVTVGDTYYCVKDNEVTPSMIKEGDIFLDARNPFNLDSFRDLKGKTFSQVQNTINELKSQGDVTITFQDGELLGKYHDSVRSCKKVSKNITKLQGEVKSKTEEISALEKIADKYDATHDLYQKLKKI